MNQAFSFSQVASAEATLPAILSPDLTDQLTDLYEALPSVNLGILASGSGSNFEAIVQAIADRRLRASIKVLIYNVPGAKVAARAQRWGIPAVEINHRNYVSREAFDDEVAQTLQQYGVDWVIMAGWMRRATDALLNTFPRRVINIHPSLLPSFPGIRAIEQALAARVKVTGCTVHLVELEVDSGPILMQAVVPVLDTDTPETLHARVQVQEHRALPAAIARAIAQAQTT